MQLELIYNLIRMFAERIVEAVFKDETGAARLQQVGLFTLIFMLQADEEPVTAARLSRMTGQSQGEIHYQIMKLLKLELIKRESIGNPKGRGRVYKLIINHTPETRRIASKISKAVGKSLGKRAGRKRK
jgi:predicted transcriptional regulator